MKRFIALCLLVVVLVVQAVSLQAAPVKSASSAHGKRIADQYIVVLKHGANAQAIAVELGVSAKHVYKAALNGFTAKLTAQQVNRLRAHALVDYIEQDHEITVSNTQYAPPWGLDRIDQWYLGLSESYTYDTEGSGVYAYIIDSGLQISHPDFGWRAANVYDSISGSGLIGDDCNGHGTHVAGIIGGTTYGVAKDVQLRGVRVLDCNGSGTSSSVLAGIDWVRLNAITPAVANISLGGSYLASVNTAVTNLANAGIFTVVAAGNTNADACNVSPASAIGVITVAASDSSDERAWFSNYGSCVDVYAPGVAIPSDWIGSGTNTIDGTSMAAPHVAGVGVLYKSLYGDIDSETLGDWIISNATPNVILNNPSGTPNRLLFIPSPSPPTPVPTATPQPTSTPRPTRTPTPTPEPTIIPPAEPCYGSAFRPVPTAVPPCNESQR